MIPTLVLNQPDRDFQILTPEPTGSAYVVFVSTLAFLASRRAILQKS